MGVALGLFTLVFALGYLCPNYVEKYGYDYVESFFGGTTFDEMIASSYFYLHAVSPILGLLSLIFEKDEKPSFSIVFTSFIPLVIYLIPYYVFGAIEGLKTTFSGDWYELLEFSLLPDPTINLVAVIAIEVAASLFIIFALSLICFGLLHIGCDKSNNKRVKYEYVGDNNVQKVEQQPQEQVEKQEEVVEQPVEDEKLVEEVQPVIEEQIEEEPQEEVEQTENNEEDDKVISVSEDIAKAIILEQPVEEDKNQTVEEEPTEQPVEEIIEEQPVEEEKAQEEIPTEEVQAEPVEEEKLVEETPTEETEKSEEVVSEETPVQEENEEQPKPVEEKKEEAQPVKKVATKKAPSKKTSVSKNSSTKKSDSSKKSSSNAATSKKTSTNKKSTSVKKDTPAKGGKTVAKEVEKKETPKDNKFNGKARVYHISTHENGYKVKLAGGERAIKTFKTQKEAIAYAKELVKSQGGSYVIHSLNGSIRKG
ncbi:MAG: DUF2188 domain-containing protein [Bacillales bacterium]|nr:DUF2188 domain-containing protein [Bacillales bacterium]